MRLNLACPLVAVYNGSARACSPQHLLLLFAKLQTPLRATRKSFHSFQDQRHTWSVLKHIYQKQTRASNKKYACFLLNIKDQSYELFERYKYIWDDADLRIAVDGSANCLAKRRAINDVDIISGDFDSIDAKLIERLQSPRKPVKGQAVAGKDSPLEPTARAPQVVETPCQKETDFTKALRVAMSLRPDVNFFFGLYYSNGTRIDHLFGLVNTLHLIKKNIFILNVHSNTISWVLRAGVHNVLKPRGQELCSLVPFNGPTEIKTQGLRYNPSPPLLLSFDGVISTSNSCQSNRDSITIDTNREILWSLDVDAKSIKKIESTE